MGESYYSPQTDYIGTRPLTRQGSSQKPPEAQTYAERFAHNPIYGNAYGLPYDSSHSVFNQPMASTRASRRTPSRASSLTRDPSTGRDELGAAGIGATGRRRRSLFEDDDDDFKISKPFKKYSLGSSDYEPVRSSDLRDRIRKMGEDFGKSVAYEPSSPRPTERTETTWKTNINSRGQPVVQRQDVTYTSPVSGSTYRRSSITELPHDSTSSTTRTRRSSFGGGEETSTSRTSTRTRKYSEESSNYGLPPRPLRTSVDDSSSSRFTSAQAMRDARKLKDSDDLSESISKMVNKMRSHHLDNADADIRSISRTVRSGSLDPFEDDSPRSRSRQRARLNQFTYGVSKRN